MKSLLIVAVFLLSASQLLAAQALDGRVVRVIDGATLVVRLADKSEQTVRLSRIDPPELCQPWGEESKRALIDVALGQDVQVRPVGRSTQNPLTALVLLGEVDLSRRQVEEGQAFSTRQRYDNGPLVKEERMAKALRRGLHAAGNAEMPRDFKRRGGRCE